MADTLAPNGEGHNSKAVEDAIRDLDSALRPYEKQIADAREAMKSLKKEFQSQTGMTMSDFNAARRLAQMEDESERTGKLNNFMTIYNALKPDEQMDWVQATEE